MPPLLGINVTKVSDGVRQHLRIVTLPAQRNRLYVVRHRLLRLAGIALSLGEQSDSMR